MKKRLLALVLGIIMIASLIAPAALAEDEVKTIYWQWPTAGDVSDEALAGMEAEFNAMLAEAGIPANVVFVPTGLFTCQQDATLMISTGEQLDIMLTAFTSIDTLVNSNQILPIEDLVDEYAPDALAKSYSALKCTYEGHLYGITTGDVDYNQNGYAMKQDYIDKYNIEVDPERIYTVDELEEIFEMIEEGEGGGIEFTTPWDDYEPGNRQYFAIGEPSGSLSGGVINFSDAGFDSTTIVDLIETDAYAEYANRIGPRRAGSPRTPPSPPKAPPSTTPITTTWPACSTGAAPSPKLRSWAPIPPRSSRSPTSIAPAWAPPPSCGIFPRPALIRPWPSR